MVLLTQRKREKISRVLNIKKLHSEVEEQENEYEYFKKFKCFKIFWKEGKVPRTPSVSHLFPVFYYEWSKRQKDYIKYDTPKLFLTACIRVYGTRRKLSFCHIDEINNTFSKNLFVRLDEVFNKFKFKDADMYFTTNRDVGVKWKTNKVKIDNIEATLENLIEFYCDNLTFTELMFKYRRLKIDYDEIVEIRQRLDESCDELEDEIEELKDKIKSIEDVKKNGDSTFKEEECVICLQNKPNILFCNCGHLCICEECDSMTENNKCPKCRFNNSIKRKIN